MTEKNEGEQTILGGTLTLNTSNISNILDDAKHVVIYGRDFEPELVSAADEVVDNSKEYLLRKKNKTPCEHLKQKFIESLKKFDELLDLLKKKIATEHAEKKKAEETALADAKYVVNNYRDYELLSAAENVIDKFKELNKNHLRKNQTHCERCERCERVKENYYGALNIFIELYALQKKIDTAHAELKQAEGTTFAVSVVVSQQEQLQQQQADFSVEENDTATVVSSSLTEVVY
jgi:hypothetical protein